MKKLLFITFFIASLFSCTTIEFENSQPTNVKSLKEFPKEIQGKYIHRIIDYKVEGNNDTFLISDNFYQENISKNKKIYLSDNIIIKKQKGYYFVNIKEPSHENWTVLLLELKSNNDLMISSLLSVDKHDDLFIENVNKITTVKTVKKDNSIDKHSINPTKRELKKLIKENSFIQVYQLKRIED